MLAKLINKQGEKVDSFEIAGNTTPRVILDGRSPEGKVFMLGETGNGYIYDEISFVHITSDGDHIYSDQ